MLKKTLWLQSTCILLLVYASSVAAGTGGDTRTPLWNNESFIKKAQAIETGNWEEVTPKEVAIAGLYELARTVDRMERRLDSQVERISYYARMGSLVVAAYLVVQLLATLVLLIRLGRKTV